MAVRYSVPCEQVLEVVHGLRLDHGPGTRFLVDGHDIGQQGQIASKPESSVERLDLGTNAELATANLSHHMLWVRKTAHREQPDRSIVNSRIGIVNSRIGHREQPDRSS